MIVALTMGAVIAAADAEPVWPLGLTAIGLLAIVVIESRTAPGAGEATD